MIPKCPCQDCLVFIRCKKRYYIAIGLSPRPYSWVNLASLFSECPKCKQYVFRNHTRITVLEKLHQFVNLYEVDNYSLSSSDNLNVEKINEKLSMS